MIWVLWRQARGTVITLLIMAVLLAAGLIVTGLRARGLYASFLADRCPAPTSRCIAMTQTMMQQGNAAGPVSTGLHMAIIAMGVFVGAPLLARELESGTIRFAWTQGIGRSRWTTVMVGGTAAVILAVSVAFAALANWWLQPFRAIGVLSEWQAPQLDLTVPGFAAWMLLAVVLGALAGAVLRRTVAAMATACFSIGALLGLASWKLNNALTAVSPLITPASVVAHQDVALSPSGAPVVGPGRSWLIDWWYTGPGGQRLSPSTVETLYSRAGSPKIQQFGGWLAVRHYTFWIAYQPAGRYWLFAVAAATVPALLALILAGATIAVLRRNAA
jgi:hypothetical protein